MNTITPYRPSFGHLKQSACEKLAQNTENVLKNTTPKATNGKVKLGCLPITLISLAITGAAVAGSQYINKQKNSAEFPIQATDTQNTTMKAEQQELKNRLNNLNLNFHYILFQV